DGGALAPLAYKPCKEWCGYVSYSDEVFRTLAPWIKMRYVYRTETLLMKDMRTYNRMPIKERAIMNGIALHGQVLPDGTPYEVCQPFEQISEQNKFLAMQIREDFRTNPKAAFIKQAALVMQGDKDFALTLQFMGTAPGLVNAANWLRSRSEHKNPAMRKPIMYMSPPVLNLSNYGQFTAYVAIETNIFDKMVDTNAMFYKLYICLLGVYSNAYHTRIGDNSYNVTFPGMAGGGKSFVFKLLQLLAIPKTIEEMSNASAGSLR